jgi:DNA-directed RNA polymerase subunit N (RpoN/RPB10)
MEFPVRCFSCGTVVGHLHEKYKEMTKSKPIEESLDELNVPRYCCRRMFISHVDMIGQVTRYPRI